MTWYVRAIGLPDGDQPVELWVDAAGCLSSSPVPDAELLPGRYVLPGLVDAHAHPAMAWSADGPIGRTVADTLAELRAWADAGVGLVRDTGSPGGLTLDLELPAGMPSVQAAGRFLAPSGQYFPALLPEPAPPERLTELALGELARGSTWVKVIGDFPRLVDGVRTATAELTYPVDAVAAMVTAVHAAGGRVAVHATIGHVADLVRAGVDSIEHGLAISPSDLELMAQAGTAWTPTLSAVLAIPDGAPDARRDAVASRRERLCELLPLARRLGVPVLAGTDAAGPIAGEIALLAECGLEPAAALQAATTTAYQFLGEPPAEPGQPATLVTYDADPRQDLGVLSAPRAVIVRGVRVR
jgi:imidazolonepropionase-like amidohydrolase